MTNAAILQLRDEGRFALDDPINFYLPFAVVHPRYPNLPITYRHLLTHTGGLNDGDAYDASYACGDPTVSLGRWIEGYFTPGGIYYDADQNFLDQPPGERYSYSNVGYGLLGYLVESISGQSLAEYTRLRLFEPLGMDSSGWYLDAVAKTGARAVGTDFSHHQLAAASEYDMEEQIGCFVEARADMAYHTHLRGIAELGDQTAFTAGVGFSF